MANTINAVNIVPEFREADLQFVVNNNPLGDLQYRNYFPLKFNTTFLSLFFAIKTYLTNSKQVKN